MRKKDVNERGGKENEKEGGERKRKGEKERQGQREREIIHVRNHSYQTGQH